MTSLKNRFFETTRALFGFQSKGPPLTIPQFDLYFPVRLGEVIILDLEPSDDHGHDDDVEPMRTFKAVPHGATMGSEGVQARYLPDLDCVYPDIRAFVEWNCKVRGQLSNDGDWVLVQGRRGRLPRDFQEKSFYILGRSAQWSGYPRWKEQS